MNRSNSRALPPCPLCAENYTYELGARLACPMCGHDWPPIDNNNASQEQTESEVIRDAVGIPLSDGDTVTVVTTVRIKGGGGQQVKSGTKVTGIRLNLAGHDGHNIDARIPGIGKITLKSSIVKRIT